MIQGQVDIPRRPPELVMRLERLGSLHQSRLSFMRILMRRMAGEGWRITRRDWSVDEAGVGHAIYRVDTGARVYALVAFAHDLPDAMRSDRVIAEAWDATFALFDGDPTEADIARLAENVPLQEAGRVTGRELTLSRANRSVRLWAHVVEALAAGRQPDAAMVDGVGYLMRTTAVYGSGKFGAADREAIADRLEMQAPFQAEMLTVYLIRCFVRDLVEHMARMRGGEDAVPLDPALATRLGIGNSTGLGMAPFLIHHPVLLNNWIMAREEALARVRAVARAGDDDWDLIIDLAERGARQVAGWRSEHPVQGAKIAALTRDIALVCDWLGQADRVMPHPWDAAVTWAETALSVEGQEWLNALVLEPYGDLVDGLSHCMADPTPPGQPLDGAMTVGTVRTLIAEVYGWAGALDWDAPETDARCWYVSEEKLEPRLGERYAEPIADYEQPLAPARDAMAALAALRHWPEDAPVADVLTVHPEHRAAIRRTQIARVAPYAEIRDNTIGADLMPIDMLRAKLSFFGATSFDPRSDRWVRISMYAGAPYPEDLTPDTADLWPYPA